MKIFYHCFGSAHTSVVAAGLHLGLLPRNRRPSYSELMSLPYFDRVTKEQVGHPFLMGTDKWGHQVYTIGMLSSKQVVLRALNSYLDEFVADPSQVLWVDALSAINLPTRIGGFLSRGLGLVIPGRPLVVAGILLAYGNFVQMAEKVERDIYAREDRVPVI